MIKSSELAPIVIFVYNRIEHTKKTIQALQNNLLAHQSLLYIISDGPKNQSAKRSVDEIRQYIVTITGFKEVIIINRERNFGLASSIIDGVTTVCKKHGKVIVLEDDLVTSKYFLRYMNDALNIYKESENIFSITGFSFSTKFMDFPKDYRSDIYLNIRPMSWSWATWIDRWEEVDWNVSDYAEFIKSPKKKEFKKGGTDLVRMLKNQMNGKLDSWYIRWTYDAYKKSKYTIYPKVSYVNNIGHDASGTHCDVDNDDIYSHKELNNNEIININQDILLNEEIVKSFNKGFNTNYKRILRRKFNALLTILKRKNYD